jgi:hypothetical protein
LVEDQVRLTVNFMIVLEPAKTSIRWDIAVDVINTDNGVLARIRYDDGGNYAIVRLDFGISYEERRYNSNYGPAAIICPTEDEAIQTALSMVEYEG